MVSISIDINKNKYIIFKYLTFLIVLIYFAFGRFSQNSVVGFFVDLETYLDDQNY